MSSPADRIKLICPGLYTDVYRDEYITMAEGLISRAYFGVYGDQAVALRASHLYVLSKRTLGESGSISSKTEGKLSVAFGSSGMGEGDLSQSNYGIQLNALIQSMGPIVSVNEGVFD